MSYYFAIIGTADNPIFEHEFGTSKQGGDGLPRFTPEARHMNQFIVHSSLDIVEEVQWGSQQMYLKTIDSFRTSTIACYITPSNHKFLLLSAANLPSLQPGHSVSASIHSTISSTSSRTPTPSGATTRTSFIGSSSGGSLSGVSSMPASEENIKSFFMEVFDAWVKTIMSPFYHLHMPIRSPVFRSRVAASARKYL